MLRITNTMVLFCLIAFIGLVIAVPPGQAHTVKYTDRPPAKVDKNLSKQALSLCKQKFDDGCTYDEYKHLRRHVVAGWWHLEWKLRDSSFHRALRAASQHFGVSYDWLHACAHGEGGHGAFVMNAQGSSASGWLQFMPGTFAHFSSHAAVRKVVPPQYLKLNSRVGQAFTGAYMFRIGKAGHWEAASC